MVVPDTDPAALARPWGASRTDTVAVVNAEGAA
jgi:hypothetical protein